MSFPQPQVWPGLTPYREGVQRQEAALAQLLAGGPEQLFFCEHPAVLTLGSGADIREAGQDHGIPIEASNRGGQVTYHGPGQRVIYPVVQLNARWQSDVRVYMRWLQTWLQAACAELGVAAELRTGPALGLWVGDAKLAAFGVKVRKGVAMHGAALNVGNSIEVYNHFTPCGLQGSRAARLTDYQSWLTMAAVDAALVKALGKSLG